MRLCRLCLLLLYVGLAARLLGGVAFAQNYDALRAGAVRVLASSPPKVGTGFVFRRDGEGAWIVTASHVVKGDKYPKVEFFQRRNSLTEAEVLYQEANDPRGLALLKVSRNLPEDLAVLPLADQDLKVDEEVLIIGFPQGLGSLAAAVQARAATRNGRNFELDGTVREGNSGGPVVRGGPGSGGHHRGDQRVRHSRAGFDCQDHPGGVGRGGSGAGSNDHENSAENRTSIAPSRLPRLPGDGLDTGRRVLDGFRRER